MKKLVLAVLCAAALGELGFSQTLSDVAKLEDAERQMKDYFPSFIKVLPDVAVQQNVQPKAWIGYLYQDPFPQITKRSGKTARELPHFTVGLVNVGVGLLSTDTLNKIGKTLGREEVIPLPVLPFPSVSFDLRIGGIKTGGVDLPFDLGFSFFTLNLDFGSLLGDDASLGLKWTNWGVDARYLVLRQRGAIPDVSAGVGFAQWLLDLDTQVIDTALSTNTVYVSGQASYTLNFFVPYLGLKMMTGTNKGKVTLTLDDSLVPPQAAGYVPEDQKSRTLDREDPFFQMQIFGGFGFDWLVFQTSVGASIDVFTGTPAFNFITRFSL
ncbi:MAG: hypothetical protein LBG08_09205 [Spirochaetaceae bacterium]|nr:hypothetical protein [Spirochaetaceae bacterium]